MSEEPKVRRFETCAANAARYGHGWKRERDAAIRERDRAIETRENMVSDYRATWHDEWARCNDCGHATVGLALPYAINHKPDCPAGSFELEPVARPEIEIVRAERDRYRQGLIDCATQAGADLSDGPPDWPSLEVWAVRAVREARATWDEEAPPIADVVGRCPSCDTLVHGMIDCPTCGLEP